MKLTFVGHDMAPSHCFRKLMEALQFDDVILVITSFIGDGKPIIVSDLELESAIKGSQLVLIGMSSSPLFAEAEVRAAKTATRLGVSFGFYADVPLCPMRARPGAWFAEMAPHAKLITGLLPHDLTSTTKIFPKADIRPTGNPMRDEMAFPRLTRTEVRARFGISDDEVFILAPGGKFMIGNALVWYLLAEAVRSLDRKVFIGFTPHPGDPVICAVDERTHDPLRLYEQFIGHADAQGVRVNFFDRSFLPMLDSVAGADVVVEFTGSGSVAAAYQRIPVVNVLPDIWMRIFAEESGDALIETVENGAGIPVDTMDANVIGTMIWRVLSVIEARRDLHKRQERAYPLPTSRTGSLDALVSVVKQYCA